MPAGTQSSYPAPVNKTVPQTYPPAYAAVAGAVKNLPFYISSLGVLVPPETWFLYFDFVKAWRVLLDGSCFL